MLARVDDIDRWLSPSRRAAIVRAVELMRGNLVIANSASDDAIEGYVLMLTPFPEPIVENVCSRFMHGYLGDRTYAPMPAQVAHECRLAIADTLAERGRIKLVLDAEVYESPTEADHAKIAEHHAQFVKETAERSRMRSAQPREPERPHRNPAAMAELAERTARREAAERAAEAEPNPQTKETEDAA
ncbi:hypothetical protein HCU64_06640 [Methylobacterium sp. C25]|uniref:hypothetical protein n=1 Tax=Methylobacterium sp. C25 TaxID=2721622 RepID=UPI001F1B5F2C|nr:hypothetical protein [Methylobacterium sp. C25]MCE4223423.1 hypothetical protein [Methylobacterium sp. C25]